MIQILNEGYSEYVKSHPEADYSTLGEHFSEYLTTDDAKNIIRKYLEIHPAAEWGCGDHNSTDAESDHSCHDWYAELCTGEGRDKC